jgi:hypothetical protein
MVSVLPRTVEDGESKREEALRRVAAYLPYSSTLKMEAVRSYETSVNF